MLNIYIEKIEQVEGGIYLTALVKKPYFLCDPQDFNSSEEFQETLAKNQDKVAEFHRLHLNEAQLCQEAASAE